MKICLFVDSCHAKPIIGVIVNGLVKYTNKFNREDSFSDIAVDAFEYCLQNYGIPSVLACASGPGFFSAIRSGCSFINGLSVGLGVPIITWSSLNGFSSHNNGDFVVAIDAGARSCYVQLRNRMNENVTSKSDPICISNSQLNDWTLEQGCNIILSPSYEKLKDCVHSDVELIDSTPDNELILDMIMDKIDKNIIDNQINFFYVKHMF